MYIEFAVCVTHVTGSALLFISTLDNQGYALEVSLQYALSFKATETDDVVHVFVMSIYVINVTELAMYNK